MKTSEPTTLPCDIVRDLLPLYHDGVVSETTGQAVETHLEGCPPCRREYEDLCTDLPQETQEEPSTQERFAAMMKKVKQKRILQTAASVLAVCGLLCFSIFALSQISLEFSPEEIEVGGVYRFEQEGETKFFLLYSAPGVSDHLGEIGSLHEKSDTLAVSCKRGLFSHKMEDQRHQFLTVVDGANAQGKPYTTVTFNGEVVWTEEANGDDPIPDYVSPCAAFEENLESFQGLLYDVEQNLVGVIYDNGHRMLWDLEGNLLADDYPSKMGKYPAHAAEN